MPAYVLTINGGSSSIKFAVFERGEPPRRHLSGEIERIGAGNALLKAKGMETRAIDAPDHEHAVAHLIDWLESQVGLKAVVALGHRVVHGGPSYTEAAAITDALLSELRRLSPIDPAHLPGEIALIEAFRRRCPALPQIACFDTAFHQDMPALAKLLPIPRRYEAAGVRRYGFHGISYAYLLEELGRTAGADAARGRIILAHLGNGASMAAVRGGKCIDTTMSFTPSAGLVMGTRSGDLDPGFLIYLMRQEHKTADEVDDLVNKHSGLLGVSGTSPDMRDLITREQSDRAAADAVALFCYQAKKWVGALAAALSGLDTLVFSGGIGENAGEIRSRICAGLVFLGIELDESRNRAAAPVISNGPTAVRIIRTDEESMIARTVQRLLQ